MTTTRSCFISHASEDKAAVAEPLSAALAQLGWTVWLDRLNLEVGDDFARHISEALASATFGVVILSPYFFAPGKHWTIKELETLLARQRRTGKKLLLPVLHRMEPRDLKARAPELHKFLAARTDDGIGTLAMSLSRAMVSELQSRLAEVATPEPYRVKVGTWQWRATMAGGPPEVFALVTQALRAALDPPDWKTVTLNRSTLTPELGRPS